MSPTRAAALLLVTLTLALVRPAPGLAEPRLPEAAPAPAVAPAPSAPAPAAQAPGPVSTPSLVGASNRLLIGSLVIAALLLVASRFVRRMPLGRLLPRADGPIKVLSRTHLGPKASLCLVEVQATTLLLAITGESISALHSWPAPGPPGAAPAAASPAAARAGGERDVPGQLRALSARLGGPR
jgi:flagellar biogenesis protein FliO